MTVVQGVGRFTSLNQLEVAGTKGGKKTVSFEQAIIAAGSEPVTLPFIPHADPRVIDSTGALELGGVPSACWSWAAGSSAWRWRPSTTRWGRR